MDSKVIFGPKAFWLKSHFGQKVICLWGSAVGRTKTVRKVVRNWKWNGAKLEEKQCESGNKIQCELEKKQWKSGNKIRCEIGNTVKFLCENYRISDQVKFATYWASIFYLWSLLWLLSDCKVLQNRPQRWQLYPQDWTCLASTCSNMLDFLGLS